MIISFEPIENFIGIINGYVKFIVTPTAGGVAVHFVFIPVNSMILNVKLYANEPHIYTYGSSCVCLCKIISNTSNVDADYLMPKSFAPILFQRFFGFWTAFCSEQVGIQRSSML